MPTINTTDRNVWPLDPPVLGARVWTKLRWSDTWIVRPDLIPTQCTWTVSPQPETASLEYHYGQVILPGESQPQVFVPITTRDFWVLILWFADDGVPMWWLGQAGTARRKDHQTARQGFPQTGRQTLPCHGLIRLLQQNPILSTVHWGFDSNGDDQAKRARNVGATFNDRQRGNRTAAKHSLGSSDEAYLFGRPSDTANETWSTRDIVEHLGQFHWPTQTGLVDPAGVPWEVSNLNLLPNWDAPELPSDGRSFAELLDALLPAKKMLGWRMETDVTYNIANPLAVPVIDAVKVVPFTAVSIDLTLPSVGTLPQNPLQHELITVADPLTVISSTEDAADVVDQIEVRGPREIGIGTFRHAFELEDTWTTAEKNQYAQAASGTFEYTQLDIDAKRAANQRARAKESLAKVFRDLRLAEDWDGLTFAARVFPDNADGSAHIPYLGELEILPDLPLYGEVDYTGDATTIDESEAYRTPVPPIVTLENPEDNTRERIEDFGRYEEGPRNRNPNLKPFAITVEPYDTGEKGLRITISGAPRHALAGPSFNLDVRPFVDARHQTWGGFDYRSIEATFAVRGTRRPRAQRPESVSGDVLRRRVFTLESPTLQRVHIAADTVVGIDNEGNALTSEGGLLRDPQPLLDAIADLIAAHQLSPRYTVRIRTQRRLGQIQVGDLIHSIDARPGVDVDAPISEIRIDAPLAEDGRRSTCTQTITAAAYPIDVTALFARL